MKTIKIFLASSEELENDRNAFGNLVRKLDKIYERRGIRIELFEWEDYDAAFNDRRKQDEYNDQVRSSDLFLALFHIKAGRFTIEEFDVATEEFRRKASPKVYVYCKDLQAGETESPELAEFKQRLFDEMGHYWCRYGNRDTMQLHFVMQLQLVENSRMDTLKVDEKGAVTLDGTPVAHMDQLPFAADNEAYRKMQAELLELPAKIEKARERVKKLPDDEDLRDDLQFKLNRYNQLKEDFAQLQQDLFSTAKTIATLQQQQVNDRLRRAIEAFEVGNLERANAILDEIAYDADKEKHIENYERQLRLAEKSHDLVENSQMIVHHDIDALLIQTSTVMAEIYIPLIDRINRIAAIYAKADEWASRSSYDKKKYGKLLFDYAQFLFNYSHYEEAIEVYERQITISEEIYGKGQLSIAASYNNLGSSYHEYGDYNKALHYYEKARDIHEKFLGINHPDTATSYINIGGIYHSQGDYDKALDYYKKAASIYKSVLGSEDIITAYSYNNIGQIYREKGDNSKAFNYHFLALTIRENFLGMDHPVTASSYNNLGLIYAAQGDYSKALEYCSKALDIREKVFGFESSDVANSYNSIGTIYFDQKNFYSSMEYFSKALGIHEKLLSDTHPDIARDLNNIAAIYYNQGDYARALKHLEKAIDILNSNHADTFTILDNIKRIKEKMAQDINQQKERVSPHRGFWSRLLGNKHKS